MSPPDRQIHATISGPIVMIGFGSIGKATLPLIERHFDYDKSRFVIVDPHEDGELAKQHGVRFIKQAITRDNYRDVLTPLLTAGPGRGMIVNLSVDTSSVDLMAFAKDIDAFYIDTVVEPWPGLYTDRSRSISQRSNYALRESLLDLRRRRPGGVTAVSCCGANPGMVSWFVKQALLDVAAELGLTFDEPKTREDWARLMQRAGVKGIHIAERDTQRAVSPKPLHTFEAIHEQDARDAATLVASLAFSLANRGAPLARFAPQDMPAPRGPAPDSHAAARAPNP